MDIQINEREEIAEVGEFAGIRNAEAIELMQAAKKAAPMTVSCLVDPAKAPNITSALSRAKKRNILTFARRANVIEVKWLVNGR